MKTITDYTQFLHSKISLAIESGFEVAQNDINPILKPHQRDIVQWAIRGGCRALFESFGLGKTIQQLEICRIITAKQGGKALIVCPLGVEQEFTQDARNLLGFEVKYIKTQSEAQTANEDVLITNYDHLVDYFGFTQGEA